MDILIVEDSATLRANLAFMLRQMGHRVYQAESGEKCLHMVESRRYNLPYELILMDVELPGLDGFETTRLIRETLEGHWIPIIFVTALADDASYEKGIEAGGDDYLTKPLSSMILKAKIRAMERIADMQKELGRLNRELKSISEKDGLTQLLNRRAFNDRAEALWQREKRQGNSTAVLMLDVDYFKQYNDRYGHIEGDKCLQHIADALRDTFNGDELLMARYGGEEFIIFIANTTLEKIHTEVGNLQDSIEALDIAHKGSPERVLTASLGVAISHNPSHLSLNQLIAAADKLLYQAKNSGRNRACVESLDSHKTILISLSDPDDLQFLSTKFATKGNIVTADSGKECLEIARYIVPDIIVLGSSLRGENGACTCVELQDHAATAAIPVLMLEESEPAGYHGHACQECTATPVTLYSVSSVLETLIH